MKKIFFFAFILFLTVYAIGQTVNNKTVNVSGYMKSNGTYVKGYTKTTPNKTNCDNYSTTSNKNPSTGTNGYKAKDYSPQSKNYGSGRAIYKGTKGGQYYINSKGNKTYVPKRK